LLDDSLETESPRILANILTWALARMVIDYGAAAGGDILHRLGVGEGGSRDESM